MQKTRLLGLTLSEITELMVAEGLPKFNAKQIVKWIYQKRINNFDEMTDLSVKARTLLKDKYEVGIIKHLTVQSSVDGTRKYLLPTVKGQSVEAVYLPDGDRHTICVSTQVGCARHCKFCMTGLQGLNGNLTAGDILNQVYGIEESLSLTNLVFMGMGEPMDNLDAVMKSIEILMSDYGRAWSAKRITVSTIGVIPGMLRFLEESNAHLAISVHNPFNDERLKMMPSERSYPIQKVIDEIRASELGRQRRFSVEYIVFKGLNDTERHVQGLAKLLNGMRCRINLIRYHTIPGNEYECSSPETVDWFRQQLVNRGFRTTVRKSRGEDIFAACGMLSSENK